jgi:hypothetical protein
MHHVGMGNIAVSEHDLIHGIFPDQSVEVPFGINRDTDWITWTGQFRWITAIGDIGNLRRGECNHLAVGIGPVHHVEVVEVAARGTQNHNPFGATYGGRNVAHRNSPDEFARAG